MRCRLVKGVEVKIDPRTLKAGKIWWPKHKWVEYGIFGGPTLSVRTFFFERMKEHDSPVILDIGAGVGSFSLLAKAHLGASIVAFEPNPWMRKILESNVALNALEKRITVRPYALSDSDGAAILKVPKRRDESGFACLGEPGRFSTFTTVEVKTKRLDGLALRPDLMKIDTEGCELFVLRGAEQTLKRFMPSILLEYWRPNTSQFGYRPREILTFLGQIGYRHFKKMGRADYWVTL